MLKHTDSNLESVHIEIASALEDLSFLFKEGYKLTFIARHPSDVEKSCLVTDDENLNALLWHVAKLYDKESVSL